MTESSSDGWGKPPPTPPTTALGSTEAEAYKVGYGRPPKASRWKPGQSGNPKGRTKKPGSIRERVQAQLDRKITTTDGRTITVSDAVLASAIAGLTGKGGRSIRASIELIRFLETFDSKVDFQPSAADEKRLETLLAKHVADTEA